MRRTWCINGRFLAQPLTGVQRYAHEIVSALDQIASEGHPLAEGLDLELVVPVGVSALPRLRSIRLRQVGRMPGHLWEQLSLPNAARDGLLSLCNTGPLRATKHVICIHDVLTREFPQSYTRAFRALYCILQPALGRTATAVATVSRFAAAELTKHNITAREKIAIAPNGYEHVLRWRPEHTTDTLAVAGPNTIVAIGSLAPHKNIGLLVGLAPRLRSAGLRIALAGLRNGRVFNAGTAGAQTDGIAWLGRLTDGGLAALLRDSLCLAFPSFSEGFGLPPLEAMALGCPVISSNAASLPEVCGDAALYASPNDPDLWYEHILRLRQDRDLQKDLATRGRQQARRFSWKASALTYLALMAKADGLNVNQNDRELSASDQHLAQRTLDLRFSSLHVRPSPRRRPS